MSAKEKAAPKAGFRGDPAAKEADKGKVQRKEQASSDNLVNQLRSFRRSRNRRGVK